MTKKYWYFHENFHWEIGSRDMAVSIDHNQNSAISRKAGYMVMDIPV